MTRSQCIDKRLYRQRGVVVIWFALLMPVLFGGFALLAIDLVRFNLTRIEVQNAADAAALAGARQFAMSNKVSVANAYALSFARRNYANGAKVMNPIIETGFWDLSDPAATWHTTKTATNAYAVRVTVDLGTSFHYYFGSILGITNPKVQATAIAAQQSSAVSDHAILVQ